MLSRSSDVLVVEALVNKCNFEVLIDTGASSNYISNATLETLLQTGEKLHISRVVPVEISLADNTRITTSGKVSLEINIDNKTFLVDFIIIKSLLFDLILGCRFCRENKVIIDFGDNSISFRESISSIKEQLSYQEIHGYLENRVTIPAHSELIVDLSISGLKQGAYFVKTQNINNAISANGIIEITPETNLKQIKAVVANTTRKNYLSIEMRLSYA